LTAPVAGTLHFMGGIPLAAVKDRESFVSARVDYLNHLFNSRGYIVAAASNPKLAGLDVLLQRLVITVVPQPGVAAAELQRVVLQFRSAGLSAPAVIGLVFGGLLALLVGFGITNVVWRLREINSIMLFLRTHVAVSAQTIAVAGSLIVIIMIIALAVSRWL